MSIGVQLIVAFGLAAVILTVWTLVDAARRSEADFEHAGHSRTLWLVLLGVGALTQLGIAVAIAYLVAVRPRFPRVRAGVQ
jgi:hypothetical protein